MSWSITGSGRRAALKACVALAPIAMVLGVAVSASAQTQPAAAANTPGAQSQGGSSVQEVVVTGSRITRADFKAESPISTLSVQTITAAAQPSLDKALGQMPQFEAAQGAAEVGDVQGSVGFGGGASYADLRGIGRNRSLVLMDGHRLMPSTPDGSIDLNTIPMSMLENLEVITGGASTAYGSDAVAGVANFKLRQKFSGVEIGAQEGISGHGDGETTQIYGIAGGSFADDRGHAILDFEYGHRDAVLGSQRSFFTQPSVRFLGRPGEGIIFKGGWFSPPGAAGGPTIAAVNAALGTDAIPGVGVYPGAIGVNTDGSIFTSAVPGVCAQNYKGVGAEIGAIISPNCTTAGVVLGNYFAVQVPLTKYNVYAKVDYRFNDHITGYAQFNFSDSTALDETSPGSSKTSASAPQDLVIPVSNPFVQANPQLVSLLNSAYGGTPPPGASFEYSKLLYGWGDRIQDFHYQVWQGLAGLKGDIPGTSFTWDVYASYGRSNYDSQAHNDISITAINNILANEGVGGCTWNPFGIQTVSSACLKYAGRTDHTTDALSSTDVELSTQGTLFNLPAGAVKIALGGDYRRSQYDYQPDSLFVAGDSLAYGSDTPSHGEQDAKELFAEALVPVLKDQPFAKDLSLDLAYRYSKYNTFAGAHTWKADASWTVTDWFRLRGGYSRAIRAPSLADLYVGLSVANIAVLDPCDFNSPQRTGANAAKVQALCAAQSAPAGAPGFIFTGGSVPVQSGGNSLLKPETANTWSIGGVISPVSGLNISVDYYNIKINGAIASLDPGTILNNCYGTAASSPANPNFSPNNAFCQRITRDPSSGDITFLTSGTFNFNTIQLDGIDTQIDYRVKLSEFGLSPDAGTIQFSTVVSYLKDYIVQASDGTPPQQFAGGVSDTLVTSDGETLYTHPHWKANTSLSYINGPFNGTLRWRYIGGMKNLDDPSAPVPAVSYFDLDAHYYVGRGVTLSAGINNLGDKSPPFIHTLELRTDAATYDVIGRTFYVAAKAKF